MPRILLLLFLAFLTVQAQTTADLPAPAVPFGPAGVRNAGGTIPVPVTDPSDMSNIFTDSIGSWVGAISTFSYPIFTFLALLNFSWFAATILLENHRGMDAAVLPVVRKLMTIGFGWWVMTNAAIWTSQIVFSLVNFGMNVSGVQRLGTSAIMWAGLEISGTMLANVGSAGMHLDFLPAIAFGFGAVFIFIAFVILTLQLFIAQLEAAIVVVIGSIFAFGMAATWTTVYVERLISYCIAVGTKMMLVYLMIGTGWQLVARWQNYAEILTQTQNPAKTAWTIAASSILFAFAVWKLPGYVGAFLGGAPHLTVSDLTGFASALLTTTLALGSAAGARAAAAGAGSQAAAAGTAGGHGALTGAIASGGAGAAHVSPQATGGAGGSNGHGGHAGGSAGHRAVSVVRTLAAGVSRMPPSGSNGSGPHMPI